MLLSIVTPQKKLLIDQNVEEVIVPGQRGELTIYDGHAPLITTLDIGVLQFKEAGSNIYKKYAISWGYCEIAGNLIKVLAETAESVDTIDKARAKKSLTAAEKELAENQELTVEESFSLMVKIKKAEMRLDL